MMGGEGGTVWIFSACSDGPQVTSLGVTAPINLASSRSHNPQDSPSLPSCYSISCMAYGRILCYLTKCSWYWVLHPDSFLRVKSSFFQLLRTPSVDRSQLCPSQRNILGHMELPHLRLSLLPGASSQSMTNTYRGTKAPFLQSGTKRDIQLQSSLQTPLIPQLHCRSISQSSLFPVLPFSGIFLDSTFRNPSNMQLFISESISRPPNVRLKSIIL